MPSLFKALLVVVLQTAAFLGSWNLMAAIARSMGRFPRELHLGVTIYYGSIWIFCLFVAAGIAAWLTDRAAVRWGVVVAGLAIWLYLLSPSFVARPFSMPLFFVLGSTILIVGSRFIRRYCSRTHTANQ